MSRWVPEAAGIRGGAAFWLDEKKKKKATLSYLPIYFFIFPKVIRVKCVFPPFSADIQGKELHFSVIRLPSTIL